MSRAAARKAPAAKKTRAASPLRHQPSRSRSRVKAASKAKRAPAKAKAKAKPRARAKAAPRVVEPVTFRLSRLPQPANRQSVSSSGSLAFGGLGWLLAGGALLWALTRKAAPAAPTLPAPTPVTPPPTNQEPAPVTPKPPVADPNASDREKLGIEYRRAKTAEIPRDVLVKAPSFLKFDMGTIHFFPAADGREFAAVLEEHFHSAESGLKPVGKHKGVSMFIKRTS